MWPLVAGWTAVVKGICTKLTFFDKSTVILTL